MTACASCNAWIDEQLAAGTVSPGQPLLRICADCGTTVRLTDERTRPRPAPSTSSEETRS